ncbi:MAG: glycosyltransferase [Rubrivivax sp.]|nr:glycosyltransferase [Rubrivivax sp.]
MIGTLVTNTPPPSLRLLYLTRERHPTQRPDLQVLFGRELPRQGVATDLVAVGDPGAAWTAGTLHVAAASGRWGRVWAELVLLRGLARWARGPVDAVQARDRFFGAWVALRAARRAGKPFFYWMSLPFPDAWLAMAKAPDPTRRGVRAMLKRLRWGLRGALAHWILYRHVLPHADHVFAQSEALAEALVARGLRRERITPVPMGIDADDMAAVPALSGDARLSGRRYAVYLGALERARQPDLLVRAFELLRETEPDLLLVLAGDSQDAADRDWLRQYIADRRLSGQVIITGWLPPQEARAYVRGADVAIATYPRSPVNDLASPTKMGEYLALAIPVVANDQPDQAYLLEQVGGGVCVPLTAVGVAEGIRTVLADHGRYVAEAIEASVRIVALRGYGSIARQLASCYVEAGRSARTGMHLPVGPV